MTPEELQRWQRRVAQVRAALDRQRANTRPPEVAAPRAMQPVKPQDAPGADSGTSAARGGAAPSVAELAAAQRGEPTIGNGTRRSETTGLKALARELRLRRRAGVLSEEEKDELLELERSRPRKRADCVGKERPCPFVSCRFNLYLDVHRGGGLQLNFPDRDVTELAATCALDVADRGGANLEEVGGLMNVTRARAQQLEQDALRKLKLRVEPDGEPAPTRRVGSCRARCADTGLTCKLPAHPASQPHRHENGAFHVVAVAGQVSFPASRRLDAIATARIGGGMGAS